jgi:hypothetical protein
MPLQRRGLFLFYLHELPTAAQKETLQMTGAVLAREDNLEGDLGLFLDEQSALDGSVLALHLGIVTSQAAAHVPSDSLETLFGLVVHQQPSRALGHEEEQSHHGKARNEL